MQSKEPAVKVLHVVSGTEREGGVISFVNQIAREDCGGVENFIWKHRDFKGGEASGRYVCQGETRYIYRSLARDIVGGLSEVGPLMSWVRSQERLVLHAHSRVRSEERRVGEEGKRGGWV